MSDPTWENRSGSRSGPQSDGDDDWRWDDIDWFEEPARESGSPSGAGAEPRTGLIPAAGGAGGQPSEHSARSAAIRRRRILALTALGLLFILALVIPLVVFGGGGGGAAEQTTPLTTAVRTNTAARTTTEERQSTTTTSPATTPEKTTLRVALPQGESLRRGDRGTVVTNLQKGLAALGFATGEPDGVFGATTEAAVVDFQQSNDLHPDGIVGTETVRLLNAALAEKGVTE